MKTITIEDTLVRRVLRCFNDRKLTQEELEKIYDRLYPIPKVPVSSHNLARMFRRSFSFNETSINMTDILHFLFKEGYCSREVTCFTDHVLDHDILVYFLTEKGRDVIRKRK